MYIPRINPRLTTPSRPGAVNHTLATPSWVNPILATPRKFYNMYIYLIQLFIQYKKNPTFFLFYFITKSPIYVHIIRHLTK